MTWTLGKPQEYSLHQRRCAGSGFAIINIGTLVCLDLATHAASLPRPVERSQNTDSRALVS
jgi:hypothetical protein